METSAHVAKTWRKSWTKSSLYWGPFTVNKFIEICKGKFIFSSFWLKIVVFQQDLQEPSWRTVYLFSFHSHYFVIGMVSLANDRCLSRNRFRRGFLRALEASILLFHFYSMFLAIEGNHSIRGVIPSMERIKSATKCGIMDFQNKYKSWNGAHIIQK